jgi:6-phosphogluconate dehydrogenase
MVFSLIEPILETLAPGTSDVAQTRRDCRCRTAIVDTLLRTSGAGHFVKMIHNGIEYGLMQAYAEGFDILKKCQRQRSCEGLHLRL